jgi:SARP family transcriptional regulator, regulator of embCAB operon
VDFRILGPLEVETDGAAVRLEGVKQRIILAALLTCANDVVGLDRLVDWLWGRRPPRSAATIVQAHVSRLRRLLEPEREPWAESRLLVRRSPGYLLHIEWDHLDALRFERLVGQGRSALERGDAGPASQMLASALGLWRGRALADLSFVDAAQPDIARLEGLRLSATAMRIDADLTLGRHVALVPELEALVREHPLDERLSGQLMIALCRCGRRADSLSVYARVRTRLARELHIEPAPASQRLAAAILSQHPDLDICPPWAFPAITGV